MTDSIADSPDNPPAFPRTAYHGKGEDSYPFPHHEQDGMTLRDYFAGQAMMGGISHPEVQVLATAPERRQFAEDCYAMADAMLKARQP